MKRRVFRKFNHERSNSPVVFVFWIMRYTCSMEQFRMEQPNGGNRQPPKFNPENVRVRLTVDEIRGQLNHNEYEKALEKFEAGDESDKKYLIDYQGNLVDWINDILMGEGTQKSGNGEVLAEVKRRFDVVSMALGAQEKQKESDRVLH